MLTCSLYLASLASTTATSCVVWRPGAGELERDSGEEAGDPGPASPEGERLLLLGCTTTFFSDNKMSAAFSP